MFHCSAQLGTVSMQIIYRFLRLLEIIRTRLDRSTSMIVRQRRSTLPLQKFKAPSLYQVCIYIRHNLFFSLYRLARRCVARIVLVLAASAHQQPLETSGVAAPSSGVNAAASMCVSAAVIRNPEGDEVDVATVDHSMTIDLGMGQLCPVSLVLPMIKTAGAIERRPNQYPCFFAAFIQGFGKGCLAARLRA